MAHEVSEEQLKRGEATAKAYMASPAYAKEKRAGWAADRMNGGFVFGKDQQYGNSATDQPVL
jgi:hypothetical protein